MDRPTPLRSCRALAAATLMPLLALLPACKDGSGSRTPEHVDVVSGNNQNVPVGTQPTQPLVVRVTDDNGQPLQGEQVTWSAATAGDAVTPAASTTDAQGQASAQWTLSGTLGAHTATATVAGLPPAQFTATRVPGAPAAVQVVSGNNQTVAVGSQPAPLVVRVVDAGGNPLAGVQVTFASSVAGDAVAPNPAATDAQGQASVQLTPSATTGTRTITATATGATPAQFTVSTLTPETLVIVSGNGQTGVRGQPLPQQLVVEVRAPSGAPVPGATVAWSVTGGGGQVSPATSASDAQGRARTTWTLGTASTGTQTVIATLQASGFQVAFTATGTAPTAASITISPTAQTAACCDNRPFFTATVRDAAGNVIPDAAVSWTSGVDSVAFATSAGTGAGVFQTAFLGTTTVGASSGPAFATAQLTVSPAGAGPVLQVWDTQYGYSFGGHVYDYVRTTSGIVAPQWRDFKVRNVGGSGTISGITVTVAYPEGDVGWLTYTLSSTTAPALLRVTVDPTVPATRHSFATITVSSTTPGTTPVTNTIRYSPNGAVR
ncbi:MAG TPA: Ig-like domain-containing protein [Longimicrobium sp.]|nr:Ig-like domain-containing protein [Longimicrobium sp.]